MARWRSVLVALAALGLVGCAAGSGRPGMFISPLLAPSADERHQQLLSNAEQVLSQAPENVLDSIATAAETNPQYAWELLTKIGGPAVGLNMPSDWDPSATSPTSIGLGLSDMEYATLGEALGHVYGGKYASMPGYSTMGSYREVLKPQFNYGTFMNMNSH